MTLNRAKLNLKIDELIMMGCNAVLVANFSDEKAEPYLLRSDVAKNMASLIDSAGSFDELCENYCGRFVIENEREAFLSSVEPVKIRKCLDAGEEFCFRFNRTNTNGTPQQMELHVASIENLPREYCVIWFKMISKARKKEEIIIPEVVPVREEDKKQLLVVEDLQQINDTLSGFLGDKYELIFVKNGEEAYNYVKENGAYVALILLDVAIESQDGFEFLQKHLDDAAISIIPVMATCSRGVIPNCERRCLMLGVADYFVAPFNPEMTIIRIQNIIRLREASMAINVLEYDALTGLYTKEAFFHHIRNLLRKNPEKHYDFVIADIDNFGLINQQYGMEVGDGLLKIIGKNFKEMRLEDMIASRIRDDVFAAFAVHGDDWNEATLQRVAERVLVDSPLTNIQIKFGVYNDVDHFQSATVLFERAMSALDSIREQYGTSYACYDTRLIEQQERVKRMEVAFDSALKNDEFELWIQPKYQTDSEIICGGEALIRWRDQDGRLISPGSFIHIFEKDGLIKRLDEYMFRRVVALQKSLLDQGFTIVPISVNISCASLYRGDIAAQYAAIVEESGVDPSFVPIEITESMAIVSDSVKDFSENLYRKGFLFHMDDFGTGYSSLSSLHVLHFDTIKLDKSLIDFIGTPSGNSILKHTIAFAKESGMKVVAEGVETFEQKEYLLKVGCNCIQGYYYSAPMPVDMFKKLLTESAEYLREYEEDKQFSLLERRELLSFISNNVLDASALNHIMGAVALCAREKGNIVLNSANTAFLDLFQINQSFIEDELQRVLPSFVHYEDRARFKQMFREAEKNIETGSFLECRFTGKDKIYWCKVHCYFLRKIEGRKEFYIYIVDKTAAHFNSEILAGVPGGFLIYHADESQGIVFSNSHLWGMYGCETQDEFLELVNYSFKGMVHPDDLDEVQSSIDEQMANNMKKLDYVEYRIRRKDGTEAVVSDFGHLVHNDADEDLFYVFISEKKN